MNRINEKSHSTDNFGFGLHSDGEYAHTKLRDEFSKLFDDGSWMPFTIEKKLNSLLSTCNSNDDKAKLYNDLIQEWNDVLDKCKNNKDDVKKYWDNRFCPDN